MQAARKTEAKNETSLKLDGDRSLVIERAFNGPARLVYDAWTKADLVAKWWAPKSRGVSII